LGDPQISQIEGFLRIDAMGGDAAKVRWPRAAALDVARELCVRLKPFCERMIVAGSLRRRKHEVGDVEILYVPKREERAEDLFRTHRVSLADEEIGRMLREGVLSKRPSVNGATAWGEKNKLALHRTGMPVDLFAVKDECWWNYLVCRTGPKESNIKIANAAQELGYKWNPYGEGFSRLSDGVMAQMGSEAEVFRFVGLPYAEPWER
jgi:DNA polymerase/3'-5' exonuclease PolX